MNAPTAPAPTAATPHAVDARIREVAHLCRVTERALPTLHRQGLTVAAGDQWPFPGSQANAPIGSRAWWAYVGTVLAVAHNTGVITMTARDYLLQAAYVIAAPHLHEALPARIRH